MRKDKVTAATARPLGVRGHQKGSYHVASHKAGGARYVESPDEGTTMLALEVDPRVVSITPQPFTMRLDLGQVFSTRSDAFRAEPCAKPSPVDGETPLERIYTPDFLVGLATRQPWIVEAKSAVEVQTIADALTRRGDVLNKLGFHYLVVPSSEVDHFGLHVNLVNLRDAMKVMRQNDTSVALGQLLEVVEHRPEEFPMAELMGVLPHLSIYLGLVTGVLATDLRSGHFGLKTVLRKAYGDLAHLQLLKLEA